jgi:hypothetical protein
MKTTGLRSIRLTPRTLTPALARTLESRGLVTFLRHSPTSERRGMTRDWMKGPDFDARIHGFHSVTVSFIDIFLSSHPKGQDEIVFLADSEKKARPLFFVFALDTRETYLRKLSAGKVTAKDYRVFRAPMNDPSFLGFTVHAGTVHCELTDRRGPREIYPSFFVLEPRALSVNHTKEESHGVHLSLAVPVRTPS